MNKSSPIILNEKQRQAEQQKEIDRLVGIADEVLKMFRAKDIKCGDINKIFQIVGQKIDFEIAKIEINQVII